MADPTDAQIRNDIAAVSRDASLYRVLSHFNGHQTLSDEQLRNDIAEAGRRDATLHRVLSHHAGFITLSEDALSSDIAEAATHIPSLHRALTYVGEPLALGDPVGDYQGRVGVGVPAGAARLPYPTGGREPITYDVTGLPAGVSQALGVLSGSPTTAQAATAVTITASDGRGDSFTKTFDFTVLAAAAAMNLKDFAFRGYHANAFTGIVYAAVYRSGIDLSASNTSRNIWSVRSGEESGATISDPEEDLGFGPYNTFIDRMRWNSGEDWVLNHANTDKDDNPVTSYFFSTWDDNEGQGKKVYIGKRDGTFISADVGDPSGDGRWVAGTGWARWEFTPGSARHDFLDAIGVNEYFGFIIAD